MLVSLSAFGPDIGAYRKGKIDEAFLAFKEIYLEMVDDIVDHL